MYYDFDFNRSSRRLALLRTVDGAQEVLLIDAASGNSIGRIGPELFPFDPRFSPDGSRLSFFGNGRIYVHSVDQGTSEVVVDLEDRYAGFASRAPDGRSLAYSAWSSPHQERTWPKISRFDLAERRNVQITGGNEPGADRFPDWSPDGSGLAFRRTLVDFPKYYHAMILTDPDGTSRRQIELPDGKSHVTGHHCWSPDGEHFVLWEGSVWTDGKGAEDRRLKVVRVDDLSTIWTLEGDTLLGGCFDPNGWRLLAASDDKLALHAIPSGEQLHELDLSELAPLRQMSTRVAVDFDTEDDAVYFLGTDGKLYRWKIGGPCAVAFEDEPEELTFQLRSELYSFTSKDGREVPVRRYLPRAPNGNAVLFEAGPWSRRDPDHAILLRLLEEGYEVVRPTHRAPGPGSGDGWPLAPGVFGRDDVQDVVDCALDWKQRFGGDGGALALVGVGFPTGFLAFLALALPEAPWSCGVTFSGSTAMGPHLETMTLPQDPDRFEDERNERSPVAQAAKVRFPLLMLHAGRDLSARIEDVTAIQASVRSSGFPCELVVFDEDPFGLPLSRPEAFARMLDFLREHSG